MSDEHVLYAFNRDWGFADSKKGLGFSFRKCGHVFGFVTISNS